MARSSSKYGNVPTTVDGRRFASAKEAKRFRELRIWAQTGGIRDLKIQPRYPLKVNGVLVATYVGDFEYVEKGETVTEDTKGVQTDAFKIKAKLFHALYGREVLIT